MAEKQRKPRRTLGTWWVKRRFRHWERPTSRHWPDAQEDLRYLARELGPWHPDTLYARSKLITWLGFENLHSDVLRLSEADVAARTAEFGADHPDTLGARSSLAWYRRLAGDLDGAVAEARVLVEECTRALGPDHVRTHSQRSQFAQMLAENGEPAEGVRLLRALYAESQALGAQRHDRTRSIRTTLVRALERNGDLREALTLLDEEIEVERGTIYGVDENLGDHNMKRLQEWRRRLEAPIAAERHREVLKRQRKERRDNRRK